VLAEHDRGADRPGAVTVRRFGYAADHFYGTIHFVARLIKPRTTVVRGTRSVGVAVLALIAALAITVGLSISSAAPVSASTASSVTDANSPTPMPLFPIISPLTVGMHFVDAIAGGIAHVVEVIATPAPIAIPAPHTAERVADGS
jgi:hypothetical protein